MRWIRLVPEGAGGSGPGPGPGPGLVPAQAVQYAALLMEISVDRGAWDEIIIEKKFNHFWLHFAVRPQTLPNRCKVTVIEKR